MSLQAPARSGASPGPRGTTQQQKLICAKRCTTRPAGPGWPPASWHCCRRWSKTGRCTPPPTRCGPRRPDPGRQRRRSGRGTSRRHSRPRCSTGWRWTRERIDGIAAGLRQVAGLPDPVGEVLRGSTLPNGLQLRQQRVPLGVVGIDLRRPAQRHRRRVRSDAEVRQRRAAARQLLGGEVQRGAGHGAARRAGQPGPARRRRAAAVRPPTAPPSPT